MKGVRLIVGGVAAIGLGCLLYALPKEVDLAWYHPIPAFLAGLMLILLGVYTIRADDAKARRRGPRRPCRGGGGGGPCRAGRRSGPRRQVTASKLAAFGPRTSGVAEPSAAADRPRE